MNIRPRWLIGLGPPVDEFQHGIGVGRARIQRAINTAAGLGQVPERLDVQPRQPHFSLFILEESALRQRHRRPLARADADQRYPVTLGLELGCSRRGGSHILTGRHHQYIAGFLTGLLQQPPGSGQAEIHARPLHRHD